MLKTAFSLCLLGLLSIGSAAARPARWPFWFSSPERHGHRKLPGDYTHHYGTYRYHSHQDNGLFGFLPGRGHCTPVKAATGALRGCFKTAIYP